MSIPLFRSQTVALLLGLACCAPSLPAQECFLRINQAGYRSQDAKVALVCSRDALPGEFSLLEAATQKEVFRAPVRPLPHATWGAMTHHAELNFSAFRQTGRYVLRYATASSKAFDVHPEVYARLPDQMLDFMRQQRCGYNPWLDAVCHPHDGRTAYGPLTNGTYLDCTGGWHDAADLLKYLITSANATAQMLLAYELAGRPQTGKKRGGTPGFHPRKDRFEDRVNALGLEGGNGLPDILDEARWGLDWMLKLHPAPDQLYHQVADDRDHCGRRLPQDEFADYGWGPGSYRVVYAADGKPQGLSRYPSEATGVANVAGRYAAAMALAYQIWRDDPQHRAFARRCLQAGREVYALGKAREGFQQGNSFKSPYRYCETTWADDMEWGAAELFRATGDQSYLREAKHYALLAKAESWMDKEDTQHYQYYPFMNVGHYRLYDLVDPAFQKVLAGYYREGIEACVARGNRNPFRIGVPFIWCSNNLTVALATQCLLYEAMTGQTTYRVFLACQRDWLMGRNPWGYSMFTGIPEDGVYPRDPHLMTAKLTGRPVRGGLVDGPVYSRIFKSLKGVGITEPDPLAAFQGDLAVYHDDIQDYSSNEPTMDGTASAILLWALAAAR